MTTHIPNAESVRKVAYLALHRISKNWRRPVLDWIAALNHFTMVFEGRIPGKGEMGRLHRTRDALS